MTSIKLSRLPAWLRDNAASCMVLIALGSGLWYLATTLASKADIGNVVTKDNLDDLATKDDLDDLATNLDDLATNLDDLATKDDLDDLATKDDLDDLATKEDLDDFATKDDLAVAVGEIQSSLATAVTGLNATVNELRGTVTELEAAVSRLETSTSSLDTTTAALERTARAMVVCVVDVHNSWVIANLEAASGRPAYSLADPPDLPENCEELRDR